MLEGLLLLADGGVVLYALLGVLVVTVVAVIPGLGGVFAIVILLPFAFRLDPIPAIALLIAAAVVSGTANTVTSVLLGVPGSSTAVATVLDGYPMAKRGEGTRAIAAGLTASALGGVFGGLTLGLLIPVMRPLVLLLGPAEFLVIIAGALVTMAAVGPGSPSRIMMGVCLGLLLGTVGLEPSTATERFTFGQLYLWDGLKIVPAMIGLFAFAEMSALMRKGTSIADLAAVRESNRRQIAQGIRDVLTRKRLLLQSSLVGVVVGIAPGIGATAGQFMAYGQATRTEGAVDEHGRAFGEGRVEGVIGADAATNSVDGGSLIPTLALGIPGSVPMAILMAVFISLGVTPGVKLLTENVDIVWMIIWLLIGANLVAAVVTMGITPLLARVAFVPTVFLVPPVLAFCVAGAYATSNNFRDVLVAFAFGFIGIGLDKAGISRVPFIIGFVLGPLLERYYLLSMRLYGWGVLARPGVQTIIVVLAVLTFAGPVRRRLVGGGAQTDAQAVVARASGQPDGAGRHVPSPHDDEESDR